MSCWCEGDPVLTSFGVGVIISCPSEVIPTNNVEQNYNVLLWRVPGKSIGSGTIAHLQSHALIMKLPVAPGMTTTLLSDETKEVMVHAYNTSLDSFLVSPLSESLSDPAQFNLVASSQLKETPSAKFYPLLMTLMRKGDETANVTATFLCDEKVTKIVEKSAKLVEEKSEEVSNNSKDQIDKITSTVSAHIPKEENLKEVYQMLRDEELTVLLEKSKERLKELMSQDVSKATKDTLQQAGVLISDNSDEPSSFSETVSKSRDSALLAMESLLEDIEVDKADVQAIRDTVEQNFTTMFHSLSEAAKSDRNLGVIFDEISGKTSAWQEATGRLISTKSGSLFIEGASRLKARATNIFLKGDSDWAGEVGSKLMKAFTEGDAALAQIKTIEMGDAIRSRLVTAIEIRSGSQGGLDGIIAGALTTITTESGINGDKVQNLLEQLQHDASGATKNARETLISVLSKRSGYQDGVLMQIEKVLCDLEKNLGLEMTPAEIVNIVSGESGTSALFEPIAKRASIEISNQLNAVEAKVEDPAILTAIQHVRKIISGELTMSRLMDEVVNALNDENVLTAGENIVKTGEIALDAIEGISSNKIAGEVMQIAEKAGITKESVMSKIDELNVNEILDTAGQAVTDEKARRELVSSATDTALDFVLRVLPSMPVPPFDGVKDGLLYNLSNLSMEGFQVKKENILVEIAGMTATKHKKKKTECLDSPAWATTNNERIPLNNGHRQPSNSDVSLYSVDSADSGKIIKATELLIIDVQDISTILDDVVWGFEQTYMPYLKGKGKANVKLSNGSIRLQFELRKMRETVPKGSNNETGQPTWKPVLCLHNRSCSIGQVDLVLQGESRLTWIFNKLATLFKGVLRDYVVSTIIGMLTSKSGYILQQLNENLAPYWGLIMQTTGLKMDELVEADSDVITDFQPLEDEDLIELVWRHNLPLGMNLLLNDNSGKLKVVDFPRGSQARAVCTEKEIDPAVFNGATIVAVNGTRYDFQEDLFEALKCSSRPKSILFKLANHEDAARVKNFVEGSFTKSKKAGKSGKDEQKETPRQFSTRKIVINDNIRIGLEFCISADMFALFVKRFVQGDGGTILAAEKDGTIKTGDILTHVNNKLVLGKDSEGQQRALRILKEEGNIRPLSLSFTEPYLIRKKFEKPRNGIADVGGPGELKLKEVNKRIHVASFENVNGTAESGGVLIGDHLIFINGLPVGAGCALVGQHKPPELSEVYEMLQSSQNYPAALTFARPKKENANRWSTTGKSNFSAESAETICVTADSFEQIGCVFESAWNLDIILTDLFAVPGTLQLAMKRHLGKNETPKLAIESINGQFVPSYATESIVMNAINRSWHSDGRVELVFCDDEQKEWVHRLR